MVNSQQNGLSGQCSTTFSQMFHWACVAALHHTNVTFHAKLSEYHHCDIIQSIITLNKPLSK